MELLQHTDKNEACCACLRVVYAPEQVGKFNRDRWACETCGCEFSRGTPSADSEEPAPAEGDTEAREWLGTSDAGLATIIAGGWTRDYTESAQREIDRRAAAIVEGDAEALAKEIERYISDIAEENDGNAPAQLFDWVCRVRRLRAGS